MKKYFTYTPVARVAVVTAVLASPVSAVSSESSEEIEITEAMRMDVYELVVAHTLGKAPLWVNSRSHGAVTQHVHAIYEFAQQGNSVMGYQNVDIADELTLVETTLNEAVDDLIQARGAVHTLSKARFHDFQQNNDISAEKAEDTFREIMDKNANDDMWPSWTNSMCHFARERVPIPSSFLIGVCRGIDRPATVYLGVYQGPWDLDASNEDVFELMLAAKLSEAVQQVVRRNQPRDPELSWWTDVYPARFGFAFESELDVVYQAMRHEKERWSKLVEGLVDLTEARWEAVASAEAERAERREARDFMEEELCANLSGLSANPRPYFRNEPYLCR